MTAMGTFSTLYTNGAQMRDLRRKQRSERPYVPEPRAPISRFQAKPNFSLSERGRASHPKSILSEDGKYMSVSHAWM